MKTFIVVHLCAKISKNISISTSNVKGVLQDQILLKDHFWKKGSMEWNLVADHPFKINTYWILWTHSKF